MNEGAAFYYLNAMETPWCSSYNELRHHRTGKVSMQLIHPIFGSVSSKTDG
jgi:hypothetical protein